MTGSSDEHKGKYENETCDVCKKNQKFTAMQCGPERHSSFHQDLMVDSANNFLDERDVEPPKTTIAKPGSDGSIKASNFKSKALYCEVKLTELLGKAGPRVRPVTPGKYEDAPDSYRTSVCCLSAAAGRDKRHRHATLSRLAHHSAELGAGDLQQLRHSPHWWHFRSGSIF